MPERNERSEIEIRAPGGGRSPPHTYIHTYSSNYSSFYFKTKLNNKLDS
nr:MAG TPA: hypothetical protein [Caudoviricetes sp.]